MWLRYVVRKKRLDFGGDPDPDLDSAAGFLLTHFNIEQRRIFQWTILQVVNILLKAFLDPMNLTPNF